MYKLLIKLLLNIFTILPPGLKIFIRSFKKQEPELYQLKWLVEKNTIAVDIGANNGAYTYALSKCVGTNGKVISVEPIKYLAKYLTIACRQIRLPAEVYQLCLSSKEGISKLFIPSTVCGTPLTGYASLEEQGGTEPGEYQTVDLITLDKLLKNRKKKVSFIKCDVEGHEIEVFKGATQILMNDRPNLLIEIEDQHNSVSIYERLRFFTSYKYNGYFFMRNNEFINIEEFDVELHQKILSTEDEYINNFIFIPIERSLNQLRDKFYE